MCPFAAQNGSSLVDEPGSPFSCSRCQSQLVAHTFEKTVQRQSPIVQQIPGQRPQPRQRNFSFGRRLGQSAKPSAASWQDRKDEHHDDRECRKWQSDSDGRFERNDHRGNGNDNITVGSYDNLTVGNGNDQVSAGSNDQIKGGNGNDNITVGSNDNLTVGNGNDQVSAGSNDQIKVGNGNDNITVGSNDNLKVGNDNAQVSA